ncbi:MAG: 4Fe-4S binding protein [Treponema sp.]|nr:4Fe-4S binding protein [Treponema sp.]
MKKRNWYDFLWVWSIIYFSLGFFNILFAWLGMIDFLVPLVFAVFRGEKTFCNRYCGRSQLFTFLGTNLGLSRKKLAPKWLHSSWFRIVFLAFFMTMFGNVIFQTYLVASGAESLREVVKLFWSIKVPWGWAYTQGLFPDWVAQFSFGFYSLMLTSILIGLVLMLFFRPRTWCTFCPMGTMTQGICEIKVKMES